MACIHYRAGCTRSYISRVPGPDEEGTYGYARKSEKDSTPSFLRARRIREDLQHLSGRSSRAVHTLLARFTRHILLYARVYAPMSLRLRSLQGSLMASFLATIPRDILLHRRRDQRTLPGVKDRILLFFPSSSSPFHANLSSLSLNPRYPRADHLGNLSFRVNDISDPDRAWEPNDLSHDVEYIDISSGGDRSLPRVSNSAFLFSAVSQDPRVSSITYV